jgi:accessory colonization factor AcfC
LTQSEFNEIASVWKDKTWDDVELDAGLKNDLAEKAKALGLDTTDEALKALLKGITDAVDNYNLQELKIQELFLGRL